MKKITTRLQKALNERYTQEQQDEFAWYNDTEDAHHYRWHFIDHNENLCVLTYARALDRIIFAINHKK